MQDFSFDREPIINLTTTDISEALALASECEVIRVKIEAKVSGIIQIPVRII